MISIFKNTKLTLRSTTLRSISELSSLLGYAYQVMCKHTKTNLTILYFMISYKILI
jgi:hypothetical protein